MESKYAFWGVIIAAIIGVSGNYFLDIYKENKIEKEKQKQIKELKQNNKAKVIITNVYLPPINTVTQSSFFAEILNNSPIDAKNLKIKLNFGESIVNQCEVQPLNQLINKSNIQSSILEFNQSSLLKNDNLYVYCLLSNPIFDSITVSGDNLISVEKYTFNDYKKSLDKTLLKNGSSFFEVIFYILSIIFIGYFTLLSIAFMNKKFTHLWN